MILRIIDKETHIFIRDDFEFNEETEIALDVEPSQGMKNKPKYDFESNEWVDSGVEWEIIEYADIL